MPAKVTTTANGHCKSLLTMDTETDRVGKCMDSDEDELEVPEPPDGGWGWFIVLASFMSNTVVDGVSYSFGIMLIELVNYYKSQKGETAWIGSLLSGVFLGSGFLVGPLTNRFGCRPIAMAGSIIAAFAFLASTAAPSIRVLFFTYGILGGIGFGMIYLPSIVSVGYYFSTKRALATGIATCGSGMGAFVFAPLTQKLLETYDWRGALVIIAGLALNCMVCGSIMRPLKAKKKSRRVGKDTSKGSCAKANNTEPGVQSTLSIQKIGARDFDEIAFDVQDYDMIHYYRSELRRKSVTPIMKDPANSKHERSENGMFPTSGKKTDASMSSCRSQMNMEDYLQKCPTLSSRSQGSANILYPTPFSEGYVIQKGYRQRKPTNPEELAKPLYRKDIFYSGNISHLPEFKRSRNDVRAYVAHVTSLPDSSSSSSNATVRNRCPGFKRFKNITGALKINLDYSLFKNFSFCMACLGNIFGMAGFYIVWVYLTDSSIHKGISEDHASLLISIMGIMNLVGKILFGLIVDRPKIQSLDMNNLCLVVSAVAVASVPFCFSYTAIAAATSVFSIFAGAYISLISIVLVDMVGLDKLTNSFGMLSLFRGAGSIIGPPMAGTVFDYTGSYDIPFYMAGGFLFISAIFTLVSPCLSLCRKKASRNSYERDLQQNDNMKATSEIRKQSKALLA